MDRTDALLARASQYLRSGVPRTAQLPNTENTIRKDAKAKAAEDEVEAYLQSLTGGGEKPVVKINTGQKASNSMPLPGANVALSGRGRTFLKTKESSPETLPVKPPQRPETIEVPLQSAKGPVRSSSISSSTYSSPSPPSSPVRRTVRTVVKQHSNEEAVSVEDEDDDAVLDRRMVAEHFKQALTSGSMRNSFEKQGHPVQTKSILKQQQSSTDRSNVKEAKEEQKRAPPLASLRDNSAPVISTSFVDDSGNVIYSLTFDDDDDGQVEEDATEQKSDHEVDEDAVSDVEDEDDSPVKFSNVLQSVDELLSGGPVILDFQNNKSHQGEQVLTVISSVESVVESSRPSSVASTEGGAGGYSDDFDESSQSRDQSRVGFHSPIKEAGNTLAMPQTTFLSLNSARSIQTTEAFSVNTIQGAEESVVAAVNSESIATDSHSGRRRAQSHGSMKLKLEKPRSNNSKFSNEKFEIPAPKEEPKVTITNLPSKMEMPLNYQQQLFGSGAPVFLMFPPQSFFQQYMPDLGSQGPPQSTAPAEARQMHDDLLKMAAKQHQQVTVAKQSPSVYLPFFLERSNVRSLVAQCRILTAEITATRMAYEHRLANIKSNLK